MSIVEKVVGKERKSRVGGKRRSSPLRKVSKPVQPIVEPIPEGAVDVLHISDRGLATVMEDNDLSRSFRFLKRGILAKLFDPANPDSDAGKVVMVTSAMPGTGKSFLAFNLAASIAREKLINVILIDGDTVRHNLSTILGIDDCQGLIEILMNHEIDSRILDTTLPGLRFIPSGLDSESATELLASEDMADILAALSDKNTVVVLDTTPLLVSCEADAMSAHVDHTVIAVEAGVTTAEEIDAMLQMLKKSGSSVSFIMNKLRSLSKSGVPDHYKFPY